MTEQIKLSKHQIRMLDIISIETLRLLIKTLKATLARRIKEEQYKEWRIVMLATRRANLKRFAGYGGMPQWWKVERTSLRNTRKAFMRVIWLGKFYQWRHG